jgi:hypothetical protein
MLSLHHGFSQFLLRVIMQRDLLSEIRNKNDYSKIIIFRSTFAVSLIKAAILFSNLNGVLQRREKLQKFFLLLNSQCQADHRKGFKVLFYDLLSVVSMLFSFEYLFERIK